MQVGAFSVEEVKDSRVEPYKEFGARKAWSEVTHNSKPQVLNLFRLSLELEILFLRFHLRFGLEIWYGKTSVCVGFQN